MISTDYIDSVLSDITLALFEDSGFYKVEYYSGGLFKFGKNMGCSFFDKKCIENANTDFKKENLGGLFNVNYCPAADAFFVSISKNQYYFETNCRYGSSLNISPLEIDLYVLKVF